MMRGKMKTYWLSGTAMAMLMAIGGAATALTSAGEKIQNQATATYKDALGNDYTSQSNLASVEVKQVFQATLESDGVKQVSSNQTAYFQHILTNTGNGEDTYDVRVLQDIAGRTDSGNFSDLKVYIDANDNGVVDAGEIEATTVTLDAGEQVSLVVAGVVPTAGDGDTFDSTLTVLASQGVVTDLTSGKGIDTKDNTNEDSVTVSTDAVLNVFKSSTLNTSTNTIDYTVTITNTGSRAAEDVVLFDGLPEGTTYVAASATGSGFGTAIDGNDEDIAFGNLDEVAIGLDLDGDGNQTDDSETEFGIDLDTSGLPLDATNVKEGVFGFDSTLPAGTSIEFNFTISCDPAVLGAGELIENIAYVTADLDGDGTSDGPQSSTKTTDKVPQSYGVTVTDTGTDGADGVNDGGDDDYAANDIQVVDSAQAGELVFFTHEITNNGNGTDTFELSVDSVAGFPIGTSFTIWNESGTVQLLNTNGEGGVDTGPMDAGEVLTVLVLAQLPPNGTLTAATGTYDLVGTSSADPAATPSSDSADGVLQEIVAPTVDLSNNVADNDAGNNRDAYNDNGVPITTETANPGDKVKFDLVVQNDSQVADSFQLSSGGTWNSGTNLLGALPSGWTVVFRDSSGSVITTTPSIAPGQTMDVTAEVLIPADNSLALDDRTFVIDAGGSDTVNGNSDGDGDYGVFFRVVSVNSGASDVKLDAVDVLPNEELTLLQDNSGQIQPGGSIDYPHTLNNDGNTNERVSLGAANGTTDWSNNLLVNTPSGPASYSSLVSGSQIIILDADGNAKTVTLDANLTFPLESGESLDFTVRVFAPTSAPNGQLDILTVTADYNGGTSDVQNIDRSEVVESQLRLFKTAAVDTDCLGAGALDLGPDGPFTENSGQAEPGDCVVWQVVATNAGVDVVTDVNITDVVPAFSQYESDTLRICSGDAGQSATAACTFVELTDAANDDEGQTNAGDIRFRLDAALSAAKLSLTQIASGASVTVRFATRVE